MYSYDIESVFCGRLLEQHGVKVQLHTIWYFLDQRGAGDRCPLYPQLRPIVRKLRTSATGLLQPKMKRLYLNLHSLAKPRMPA